MEYLQPYTNRSIWLKGTFLCTCQMTINRNYFLMQILFIKIWWAIELKNTCHMHEISQKSIFHIQFPWFVILSIRQWHIKILLPLDVSWIHKLKTRTRFSIFCHTPYLGRILYFFFRHDCQNDENLNNFFHPYIFSSFCLTSFQKLSMLNHLMSWIFRTSAGSAGNQNSSLNKNGKNIRKTNVTFFFCDVKFSFRQRFAPQSSSFQSFW